METELKKPEDEFSKTSIAMYYGKMQKLYEDIVWYLGVFDGVPKNEGR